MTDNRPLIYIIRIEFLDILIDRENRLALNEDRRPRRRGNDEPVLVVLCCFGFVTPEFDYLIPAHDFGDEAGAGHAWDEEGGWGWRAPVPLRVAVGEFVVDVDSSTGGATVITRIVVILIFIIFILLLLFSSTFCGRGGSFGRGICSCSRS